MFTRVSKGVWGGGGHFGGSSVIQLEAIMNYNVKPLATIFGTNKCVNPMGYRRSWAGTWGFRVCDDKQPDPPCRVPSFLGAQVQTEQQPCIHASHPPNTTQNVSHHHELAKGGHKNWSTNRALTSTRAHQGRKILVCWCWPSFSHIFTARGALA